MNVADIGDAELNALIGKNKENVMIIDVREPYEYEIIRFKGSRLIPVRELLRGELKLEPGTIPVLVCRTGSRSMIAARNLRAAPDLTVYNLEGGIAESYWKGSGLLEYGNNAKMINNYFRVHI